MRFEVSGVGQLLPVATGDFRATTQCSHGRPGLRVRLGVQMRFGLRPTGYGVRDWPPGDIRPAARRVEANALVPSHRHRSSASRFAPSTRISRD
jgi:hypothetical protein